MNTTSNRDCPPAVWRKEQHQVHTMEGNHIAGVATPSTGARQVEMWLGRMDAGSATPPHRHDTEEIVHFIRGSGWACVDGREVPYGSGDTLMLPAGQVHQLFCETESEFVSAMLMGATVSLPDGVAMDLPWRT